MIEASRQIIVRPTAASEMDAAFGWYENQRQGLGSEYLRAVDAAFAAIARQPGLFRAVRGPIRRVLLRRFPYGVFFVEGPNTITVLAVVHVRRSPAYWPRSAEG
jgi:plasmid stabilization system protein ParE